jgi:hypothetical protein
VLDCKSINVKSLGLIKHYDMKTPAQLDPLEGTNLYPQKLTLTSATSGGRSVGVVRSQTKATEFVFVFPSF